MDALFAKGKEFLNSKDDKETSGNRERTKQHHDDEDYSDDRPARKNSDHREKTKHYDDDSDDRPVRKNSDNHSGNPAGGKTGAGAQNPNAHKQPTTSELMASAKLVAATAQSQLGGGKDGKPKEALDTGKLAGAAADILAAASHYGKFGDQGIGKYIGQAEEYLHGYELKNSTPNKATGTTGAGAQAPTSKKSTSSTMEHKDSSENRPKGNNSRDDHDNDYRPRGNSSRNDTTGHKDSSENRPKGNNSRDDHDNDHHLRGNSSRNDTTGHKDSSENRPKGNNFRDDHRPRGNSSRDDHDNDHRPRGNSSRDDHRPRGNSSRNDHDNEHDERTGKEKRTPAKKQSGDNHDRDYDDHARGHDEHKPKGRDMPKKQTGDHNYNEDSEESEGKSSGGYGDYIKIAQGMLNKKSSGDDKNQRGGEDGDSGGALGGVMKMAQGLFK